MDTVGAHPIQVAPLVGGILTPEVLSITKEALEEVLEEELHEEVEVVEVADCRGLRNQQRTACNQHCGGVA